MSSFAQLAPQEWRRDGYLLSTDRQRLDVGFAHAFLAKDSYWAKDLPRDVFERALEFCLPFGLYTEAGEPVGFARVVTDCAMFAYLRDVFVVPGHRGRGLAGWIAQASREHSALATVTNWMLGTADAHEVYKRAGYAMADHPEWYMQVRTPGWKARPGVADGCGR